MVMVSVTVLSAFVGSGFVRELIE